MSGRGGYGKKKGNKPSLNWSNNYATRYHDVKLPPTMACFRCNRVKVANNVNFSDRVLAKAKEYIATTDEATWGKLQGGDKFSKRDKSSEGDKSSKGEKRDTGNESPFACIMCTEAQDKDITCARCHKEKDPNEFSKAQRKNGDNAECRECVEKRLRMRVDEHEPSDDETKPNQKLATSDDEDDLVSEMERVSFKTSSTAGGVVLPTRPGWQEQSARSSYGVKSASVSQTSRDFRAGWQGQASGSNVPNPSQPDATRPAFNAKAYGTPKSTAAASPSPAAARTLPVLDRISMWAKHSTPRPKPVGPPEFSSDDDEEWGALPSSVPITGRPDASDSEPEY